MLRPRPGISPPHGHMAHRDSIAPGPGGPFRPRPYWLALPPPIHGPPPGGVYPMAGAYDGQYTGGRVHGAGWLLPDVSHGPGRYISLSKCRELCRGAAPMGAGLVPSTGAAGAVKMGGRSHARNGGRRLKTVVLYHKNSLTVNKNRYAKCPKTGVNGYKQKSPKYGQKMTI